MIYSLPYSVKIGDKIIPIRNKCDYRIVLDVIEALNDDKLDEQQKLQCALYIFYGNALNNISDYDEAVRQMMIIINGGEEDTEPTEESKKPLMNWEHDFAQLAPPIGRILGYDVRDPERFTHWYTFVGGYKEIGECTFSTIMSIRSKRSKGKKLEKWEEEFYKEHRKLIDLPQTLTKEEQDFLDSEW